MTNATDALRALLQEAHACALSHLGLLVVNNMTDGVEETKALIGQLEQALPTPAGSASGEVQRYFRGEYGMVAAGPEYPHRDGDTYWVAEQDYAALQAEVAQLQAALAEARRDAERLDWAHDYAHALSWNHDGERIVIRADDGAEFTGESWRECIDAALHQRKENGHGA